MINPSLKLSLIVPMYNEGSNISYFYNRITKVLEEIGYRYEIICINDGSKDDTMLHLMELNKKDSRIKIINLSRNFGKEIAMSAGLNAAKGDAIIPIDADLQDPPELIPELIDKWLAGYDVVYATRTKREGETWAKKATAKLFYKFMRKITNIDIPADTGDFRLMSRRVVDALNQLPEHHRFMKGLFSWVGFKQTGVSYQREPRHAGKSSFNYWKLWNFAIEGITSFSFAPLKMSSYLGFIVSFLSVLYMLFLIVRTIFFGNEVPGYPSLMVTILFFGGVQLMSLGFIGEYVGRIYNESKRRPLYFVSDQIGFDEDESISNKDKIVRLSR
ncbi:glycosyltransferase family 2 protein [Paenibacillus elgii]